MLEDERFHRDFADGRVRELCGFERGRTLLQDEVDRLAPEMLCWFGPRDEPGVRALADDGLIDGGGDHWRATYLDRVTPVLNEVGVKLPDHEELPWDRWNPLQRRLEA
jgi:1,2-phenylacetyl-CoA epoxidase catalytic subunit